MKEIRDDIDDECLSGFHGRGKHIHQDALLGKLQRSKDLIKIIYPLIIADFLNIMQN